MGLTSALRYIPADHVSGVELGRGLFLVSEDDEGNLTAEKNTDRGFPTAAGGETFWVGEILAVYDGTLNPDGTVNGSVGYVKITAVSEDGRYAWECPDYEEVAFIPDNIPVRDDGSFEDGQILLPRDQMAFEGPLFDSAGRVAGVIAGTYEGASSVSLAAPVSAAFALWRRTQEE